MVDAVGVVQSPGQIWNFLSVRDESISLARDGQDVVGLVGTLAERPSKRRDLASEIVFLNGRVGPDAVQQLVLRDKTIAMFEQDDEHVEGLRRDRHSAALAPQPSA